MRFFEFFFLPVLAGTMTREEVLKKLVEHLNFATHWDIPKYMQLRIPEPQVVEDLRIYAEIAKHPNTNKELRRFVRTVLSVYT